MYDRATLSGGHHAKHSHCDSTVALRALVATELHLHIARMPSSLGLSLSTMQPFDCMLFLEIIWIHKHGRTVLDTGETCPAASSLRGVSAALEHLFWAAGRSGEWSLMAPYNNPCRSALVADYERGLGRHVRAHGPRPLAAHPLSYVKLVALIDQLDSERQHMIQQGITFGPATYARIRYVNKERDALLYLYLYASMQRGGEGAAIGLGNLSFPGNHYASLVIGDARLLTADSIRIHPPTLKTSDGGPPPPSTYMDVPQAPDARHCFMRRLLQFMDTCFRMGVPLTAPAGPLFRPMGVSNRTMMSEESLTTSACYSTLTRALKAAGIYEGESTHSFRRGASQNAVRTGQSKEEIKDQMHIVTDAVFHRYTDDGCETRFRPLVDPGGQMCPHEPVGEEEEDLAAAAAFAEEEEEEEDRFAAAFAAETAAGH
jgi:hypothetical protein